MPGDATTQEFDLRRDWVWRVLGIRLTDQDQADAVTAEALVAQYEHLDGMQPQLEALLGGELAGWPNASLLHEQATNLLSVIRTNLLQIDAHVVRDAVQIHADLQLVQGLHDQAADARQHRLDACHGAQNLVNQAAALQWPYPGPLQAELAGLAVACAQTLLTAQTGDFAAAAKTQPATAASLAGVAANMARCDAARTAAHQAAGEISTIQWPYEGPIQAECADLANHAAGSVLMAEQGNADGAEQALSQIAEGTAQLHDLMARCDSARTAAQQVAGEISNVQWPHKGDIQSQNDTLAAHAAEAISMAEQGDAEGSGQALIDIQRGLTQLRDAIEHCIRLLAEATDLDAQVAFLARHYQGNIAAACQPLLAAIGSAADMARAGNAESAEASLATCHEDLARVNDAVEQLIAKARSQLEALRGLFAHMAPFADLENPETAAEHLQSAVDAFGVPAPDLALVAKLLSEVQSEVDRIADERQTQQDLEIDFRGKKIEIDGIKGITEFSDSAIESALEKVWSLCDGVLEKAEENALTYGWESVIGEIEPYLVQARKLAKKDVKAGLAAAAQQKAAEDLAEQQKQAAAAAAKALQQQQVAAALAASAALDHEIAAAKKAGDAVFGGSELLQKIWKRTRPCVNDAVHSNKLVEDTGIGGEYSYSDIMAAIAAWNGRNVSNQFVACHVPQGKIQDKHPKGRDCFQANFISEWGKRGKVDVHVTLKEEDWGQVPKSK